MRLLTSVALVVAAGLSAASCGPRQAAGDGMVAPPSPQADAGAIPTPGGNGGPATPADGGTASGAPADAGASCTATLGGLGNTEPDGGPAGAEEDCEGLRFSSDPGAPAASHFTANKNSFHMSTCAAGVSSGTGMLALAMVAYHTTGTVDFLSPSGTVVSSAGANAFLIAGERGFIGYSTPSMTGSIEGWNDAGASLGKLLPVEQITPAEDPLGGVVAFTAPKRLTSFDESLAVRWSVPLPAGDPVGLGVDRAGATLLLVDGASWFGANTVAGMWIDRNGAAGEVFEMLGPQCKGPRWLTFTLSQRVGSGLFVAVDSEWIAQIDSLATTPSAAPGWLQARPGTRLHMVRGGKGYAVLPLRARNLADCAQSIDVVSPSGASCGRSTFRAASGSCDETAIAVGYDGTVMQLAPDPDPAHYGWYGAGTCYWQWWPGFFR